MKERKLDKIKGMFISAFLGDALGAPHEFYCNRKVKYTGKLEHVPFRTSRFQGKQMLSIGQVTDDSEMTLTLLQQILDGKYDKQKVVLSYLEWANSGLWAMGRNTRELFKGIKTFKGYTKRYEKILIKRKKMNGHNPTEL